MCDSLFVEDHVIELLDFVTAGPTGETYNIGEHNEVENIEVVKAVCEILDQLMPSALEGVKRYEDLITFMKDPPRRDACYAINSLKIHLDLGWVAKETFESGLRMIVELCFANENWWRGVLNSSYQGRRLGVF